MSYWKEEQKINARNQPGCDLLASLLNIEMKKSEKNQHICQEKDH